MAAALHATLVALGNGNGKQPVGQLGEGKPSPLRVSCQQRGQRPYVSQCRAMGEKMKAACSWHFLFDLSKY